MGKFLVFESGGTLSTTTRIAAETRVFISCAKAYPYIIPPPQQSGWVGLIMGKGSLQSLNYFPSIWKEQYQQQKHGLTYLPSKSSFVLP